MKTPSIRCPRQINFNVTRNRNKIFNFSDRIVPKKSPLKTFQAEFDCVTTGTILKKNSELEGK